MWPKSRIAAIPRPNTVLIEPEKFTTIAELHVWRDERLGGERMALVPTMGNLHAGHLALIEAARANADCVLVSIFVNPTQFAPGEDYAGYPRTLEGDLERAAGAGADAVFAPAPSEMYPFGTEQASAIEVPALSQMLEGELRPGHFRGVASVVTRLFNLARPDTAVFGEKDYQQLLVIRRLVTELFLALEIIGVATVREPDGLALSSRNQYLTRGERERAPRLYRALAAACGSLRAGASADAVERRGAAELAAAGLQPEYFAVRDAATLGVPAPGRERIVLAAARLGQARLIDNLRVNA
jgi:pantoate--beta-alanine ligase